MLNIILVSLMALCILVGLVVLFFPFGQEKAVKATNTTNPYAHRITSLEAIRNQARIATAADVHIFVMWYRAFQGYRNDIPASIRYVHMMEWRAKVDELYKELPAELVPMWNQLVHGKGHNGLISQGFK